MNLDTPRSTVWTRHGHSPEPAGDDEDVDEEDVACVVTADDL